jgi:hypothetical protein
MVDRLALARVEREREAAIARYRRNRDAQALETTMARLDAEEAGARRPRTSEPITAAEARTYLEQLADSWHELQDEPGKGRRMLAEAVFERIDVLGFREGTVHLTDTALAHGLSATIPSSLVLSGYGRGERI